MHGLRGWTEHANGWAADPAQWERLHPGSAPRSDDAARAFLRLHDTPTLDAIHADFCAQGFGPVETLAIPSRGLVSVHLPSPPDGAFERAAFLERAYAARLPASTCFTVRWRESVDMGALEGVAYTLLQGAPVRGGEPRTARVTIPITQAMRDDAAVKLGAPVTLHLAAPHADLRALFDAIGRALESAGPQGLHFDGHPLTVTRDEMLFLPTWQPNSVVSAIVGDARALRTLRRCVSDAMTTTIGALPEWCKGQPLLVTRKGGRMATAEQPDTTATRYQPNSDGPGAWRWGTGE